MQEATTYDFQTHILQKRLSSIKHLLVCDIDNTLTGNTQSAECLIQVLEAHNDALGFAVATGRSIDSALSVLASYGYPHPDILITSVGSEIQYGLSLLPDRQWSDHINHLWDAEAITSALQGIEEIELQKERGAQRPHKVSYTVKSGVDTGLLLLQIKEALRQTSAKPHIILSHHTYLDILPHRADKGKAILHAAHAWGIAEQAIIAAGDSENDRDMFTNGLRSIIVANHQQSLETLQGTKHIFFATSSEAAGVLEGLLHFGIIR